MPDPLPRSAPVTPRSLRRFLMPLALGLCLAPLQGAGAASDLLESVKQNPSMARQMCAGFKQLNGQGISATSRESIASVARAQGLSSTDAEILITYVIGLHCSDVR